MTERKLPAGGWLVTAPAALGAAGYLLLLFLPTAAAIRQVRADMRLKQDYVVSDADVQITAQLLEGEFARTQEYCELRSALLPRAAQLSRLYGRIILEAENAGLAVTRFEPQGPVQLDTLHEVPVLMGVTGSFLQVQDLIAQIEQVQAVWVEEVSIEPASEAGGTAECELRLVVFAESSGKSG